MNLSIRHLHPVQLTIVCEAPTAAAFGNSLKMTKMLLLWVICATATVAVPERVLPYSDVQDDLWLKLTDTTNIDQSLKDQSLEFPQEIVQMADNIWIATGFALSNSILVVGEDGYIIIDTLDSYQPAYAVAQAFQNFTQYEDGTQKPLTCIIYTHDHPDHVSGTRGFLEVAGVTDPSTIEIWAYESLTSDFWAKWQYLRPQLMARSLRQIGLPIPNDVKMNSGLGPFYVFGNDSGVLLFPPNRFMSGDYQFVSVSGIDMTLFFMPGETKNMMGVFIHASNALCVGDNYYHTFPNLYAIRGTPPRPISEWMRSVDIMLGFNAEIMLPGHTKAITGATEIRYKLTIYRDAIQYVIDQSMRLINKGYHPNDIGMMVQLPDAIRDEGPLEENYGIVEWSAKSVFESQLGWFSGSPEELYPVTLAEGGCRNLEMMGRKNGKFDDTDNNKGICDKCKQLGTSYKRGRCYAVAEAEMIADNDESTDTDMRWALTLISYAVNCDTRSYMDNPDASTELADYLRESKRVRGEVMIRLANMQPSPNGRNYLLAYVTEENGLGPFGGQSPNANDVAPIQVLPFPQLLEKLKVLVIPEIVADQLWLVDVAFGSTCYQLTLRHSVLIPNPCTPDDDVADLIIAFDDVTLFRNLLIGSMSSADFALSATVNEYGLSLDEFLSWFENVNQQPLIPYSF